jgi:hypothetical protein
MEQLGTMRNSEFKEETKFKPITIKDSRFGIRKIFINKYESPSIGTYVNPGRGPNGESSN